MSVWATRAALLSAVIALFSCGGGGGSSPVSEGRDTQLGGGGPSADGSAGICYGTTRDCFDVDAARITKYKHNKPAAASYTFDDGYSSSFKIAEIFERMNARATFYIVPGTIANEDWIKWKGLAQKGHEIGNHSMTHEVAMGNTELTDEELRKEIVEPRNIIAEKIGISHFTFAFPWHQYHDRAYNMAMQHHVDVRKLAIEGDSTYSFAFFDMEPEHYPDPSKALETLNAQLESTVNAGGWYVAGGHGLDGEGWGPVPSEFLEEHLAFANRFSSRLWIDTYLNVVRYRMCRNQVTPNIVYASDSEVGIRLEGSFDPSLCTEPLTFAMPLKAPAPVKITVRDLNGQALPFKYVHNMLLIDLRPGSKAIVTLAKS